VLRGSERSARLSVHTLDRVIGSPTRRSRRSSSTSATGSTTWWSTRPAMTSGAFWTFRDGSGPRAVQAGV